MVSYDGHVLIVDERLEFGCQSSRLRCGANFVVVGDNEGNRNGFDVCQVVLSLLLIYQEIGIIRTLLETLSGDDLGKVIEKLRTKWILLINGRASINEGEELAVVLA